MLVFYFRQLPLITEYKIVEILEVGSLDRLSLSHIFTQRFQVLCKCLDDEVVEVREMAAT